MTSIDEHKRKIKEHLEGINETIEAGIEKRPMTIGFHCSACSIEFLELYLHLINKIPISKIIKHDWFKRPTPNQKIEPLIERKNPVQFPEKEKIYDLIYSIEEKRNSLIYGKPSTEQIKKVVFDFNKLKDIFYKLFENEKFEL
ncbi:MAG TPA: hypothetical protein VJI69_08125 [Bacteroidia bacterium]|nr:hypothetical protein [Bacteroidia bacterium]